MIYGILLLFLPTVLTGNVYHCDGVTPAHEFRIQATDGKGLESPFIASYTGHSYTVQVITALLPADKGFQCTVWVNGEIDRNAEGLPTSRLTNLDIVLSTRPR